MSETARILIVVYQDDHQIAAKSIGYYAGQPYTVRLDTPDGCDWKIEHVVQPASPETK